MLSGLIFNIQRYSIQDGPGIRTTVFLKGCPLSCWWCHNPEGMLPAPEILVIETRCLACGECRRVCPNAPIAKLDARDDNGRSRCTLCGACVAACPSGARELTGKTVGVAEVISEVLRDRIFYDQSGGGVTFSGGEPLMQPEFLRAILAECRAHGIHTAVDTCGFCAPEHLLDVAQLTDLFLYDVKFVREDEHIKYTGRSNLPILENLSNLGRVHDNIWIRFPVIPGINDDDAHVEEAARFSASVSGVRQVNLLPYHKIGVAKFRRVGLSYQLEHVPAPTPERLKALGRIFSAHGLNVTTGG